MLKTLETNPNLGQVYPTERNIDEALAQMERNGLGAMFGAVIFSDRLATEEIEKTEADKASYKMLEKDLLRQVC